MANYKYVMEAKNGHYFEGVTDQHGKTQRIYTVEPVVFTVRKNKKASDTDIFTPARTERFNEEW